MDGVKIERPLENRDDRSLQIVIGNLLRIGVLLSSAIVLFGGLLVLIQNGHHQIDFTAFKPEQTFYTSIGTIVQGISEFNGYAIVQLGVFLLILTPIARLVFSVIGFLVEKDYLYVAIGLLVIGIISLSFYLDIAH